MTQAELFEKAKADLDLSLESFVQSQETKAAMRPILDLLYSSQVPASTSMSKHGAFDGGLTCHVNCVWKIAASLVGQSIPVMMSLSLDMRSSDGTDDIEERALQIGGITYESLFKVCVIHDLNKIRNLDGTPYYVPNMLASGARSTKKPWERSSGSDPVDAARKFIESISVSTKIPGPAYKPFIQFLDSRFFSFREGLVSLAIAESVSPGILQNMSDMEKEAVILHDGAYAGRTGLVGKESMLQTILHAADMLASRFFC